jgi:hypothetical protein
MHKSMLKAALAAVLALGPAAAMAEGLYIGGKAGIMATDANGFDDATNAGVVVGVDVLGIVIGDISLEGEYTTTIDEGTGPGLNDWEVDTLGGYAVLRTAGPAYLKAKGGVVRSDVSVNGSSGSSTDPSAGLGVGFSLGIVQLELEYTKIDGDGDDIDFVSLQANFF